MTEQLDTHPVAGVLTYVRRVLGQGVAVWHHFWFDPLDPLMLGMMRLLTGWMLFYNLLVWSLQLETFFGRNGLQPLGAVKRLYESRFVFSFWLWVEDQYLWPVHMACLVVAAMFCIGAATRVTSILAFLITISYSQRVPVANFGFDQVLGMMCLYLALAPCGAAISADNMLRKWWLRGKNPVANITPVRFASARMASRLIQLHLCAIYFWSGFSKLKGPTWWTGEAMWNVIANQEYQTVDLTWMAWTPWLPFLIAHVTIAWEVFFIVLVWNRRLMPFVLAMGTAMHIGIGAFLGMWTFGLIMTFAYLSFADPEIWRTRIVRLRHRFHRRDSPVFAVSSISAAEVHPAGNWIDDLPPALLLIAMDAQHRSTLREHFRGHEFECRAVDSADRALHLLHRHRYSAIVIHGCGFLRPDLLSLVSDVLDYSGLPVLVLLADSQVTLKSHFDRIPTVQCQSLPASLREVRNSLEILLARCGNPGDK